MSDKEHTEGCWCGEWHDPEKFAVECTAPAPQNPWKEVIADACCAICTEFYPDDPQKSLISLIHWHVQTALDPRVSEAAAKLLAATPQVTPELELEQEVDGRWIAELLGIAAYGKSREEAIRNAAKVLIESKD